MFKWMFRFRRSTTRLFRLARPREPNELKSSPLKIHLEIGKLKQNIRLHHIVVVEEDSGGSGDGSLGVAEVLEHDPNQELL